jgi:hypothetical protein
MVMYRGVEVIEGWPEKIRKAQEITTCIVHGKEVPRIRYGEEKGDRGANQKPCHDCAVVKGEFHVQGCDVEQCAGCGKQRFSCDCEPRDDEE